MPTPLDSSNTVGVTDGSARGFGRSQSPRQRRPGPPTRVQSVGIEEAPGLARGEDGFSHPIEVDVYGRQRVTTPSDITLWRILETLRRIEFHLAAMNDSDAEEDEQ